MTAQVPETLIYNGEECAMCTEPLNDYFRFGGHSPDFQSRFTTCWRGYVGTWDVVDGSLYLIKLRGWLRDGSDANLQTVFPGYPDRVFAHWFTGTVRLPQGKLLRNVHMGFDSEYERDLFIRFEKGVVVGSSLRENGGAPERYRVVSFPSFLQRDQ